MPKPFPWPLNVGTDICSIPRIFNILKKNTAPQFVRRVLTPQEQVHYHERVYGPLKKWRETIHKEEQIKSERYALGLSILELTHCFDGRKSRREGTPTDWLREFRQQRDKSASSAEVRQNCEGANPSFNKKSEIESSTVHAGFLGSGARGNVGEQGKQIVESAPDKYTISTTNPQASKRENGVEDLDNILRLMGESEVAVQEAIGGLQKAAVFMAGRFAAKEAALKAHHNQRLTYHRISILPAPMSESFPGSRPPVSVVIPDGGKWGDGQEVKISISHDGEYATAVCLACDLEPDAGAEGVK